MAQFIMKPPAGILQGLGANGKIFYARSDSGLALVDADSYSSLIAEGWIDLTPPAPASQSYVQQVAGLRNKIKTAIAAAKNNNWAELAPWTIAPLWVTGTTYYQGWFVRNSANDLYQMHPSQVSGVAGATMPTHTDNSGVFDGGGSSGCLWLYRGKASGIDSVNPYQGNPPTNYTDTMNGYYAIYADVTAWSASSSSIAPTGNGTGTLTAGGTIVGVLAVGSPVYGVGVASGTFITALGTGTGGAGTYIVNNSQTVGPIAVSWGKSSVGLGLTQQFIPTLTRQPYYLTGGPIDSSRTYAEVFGTNIGTKAVPSYQSSSIMIIAAFETNAKWISFTPAGPIYNGDGLRYKIEVDGRMVSLNRLTVTAPTSANNSLILDLSKFPSTATGFHKVRIFWRDSVRNNLIYVIAMGPNDVMIPIENPNRTKWAFEGDSLTAGGNGMPYDWQCRWHETLCAMLGVDSFYCNAVGGTGFISDNAGTMTKYADRLDRINLFGPDVIVIAGDHNDNISTSSARQAAILDHIVKTRAANPNAILIYTGPKVLRGDSFTAANTGLNAAEADVLAAVTTSGDANTYFISTTTDPVGDVANSSGWWSGGSAAGRYFYNAGSYTDSHPLPAEHDMFAHRMYHAICAIFNSSSV